MNSVEQVKLEAKAESQVMSDFARVMQMDSFLPSRSRLPQAAQPRRLNLKQDDVKNGLGQLVLTVVKLLHELLEKQAIRRIEGGSLNDDEIERLGLTLMKQAQEIERLRKGFHLKEEDINIDLGPLGKLLKEGL